MSEAEIEDVLDRTREMLRASYSGYKQFQEAEGERRIIGLYNAVTFGRSVSFVLQNLRGNADEFDEWYDEKVEVLKEDPICSYMADLRNSIVKEGDTEVSTVTEVEHLNMAEIQRIAPPWADGIFVGDQYGGSGFIVERPDGSEVKFYYEFPDQDFDSRLYFEGLEDPIGESEFPSGNAEEDLRYYIRVLAELVSEASDKFESDNKEEPTASTKSE